ncbi:uncharacterized protein [Nicotiana tomentosiformis]|uniref:uncharacterized protein n=1 Tax=Nicotiana tomentosiformis TaxID=4098 RepID=UPI00388C417D
MALQKKAQHIVSAMKLYGFAKRQFQDMRDSRRGTLVEDVSLFCVKHGIVIPEMDMNYVHGKLKHKKSSVTYYYHLRVEVFYAFIDLQLSELNNRFSEVNIDILLGMASLSPENSCASYDKDIVMKLATHYPNEFTDSMLEDLDFELDIYIGYVREAGNEFSNLKRLGDLLETLLSLILPVATTMVERDFSSMKYVKNDLQSRIGDEYLNDCLVCYIKDEVFQSVPNDAIIDHF